MNSAAGAASGSPRIPQPAGTPEALRAALALVAPDHLPAFDAVRVAALQQSREAVSADPLRRFVRQGAVRVARERNPQRAGRLR